MLPDSHLPLFTEISPSYSMNSHEQASTSSYQQQFMAPLPSVSPATEPVSPSRSDSETSSPLSALQPLVHVPALASQARRRVLLPKAPPPSQNTALLRRTKTIKEKLFLKELDSREKIAATREEGRNKRFKDKLEFLMKLEDSKTERAATASKEKTEMFLATLELLNQKK